MWVFCSNVIPCFVIKPIPSCLTTKIFLNTLAAWPSYLFNLSIASSFTGGVSIFSQNAEGEWEETFLNDQFSVLFCWWRDALHVGGEPWNVFQIIFSSHPTNLSCFVLLHLLPPDLGRAIEDSISFCLLYCLYLYIFIGECSVGDNCTRLHMAPLYLPLFFKIALQMPI